MTQNAASLYLAEALVQQLFGSTPFVKPAQYFLGLWVGNPGRDGAGGGAEVIAAEYERLPVTLNPVVNQQKARNANNLIYADPLGPWGQISHWALYDDLTDANIIFSGAWDTPVTIDADSDPFEVPINGLEINLANVS